MAITLYGSPNSPNSRKVHWALEELGQAHSYSAVDMGKGAHKAPEFLAINPNGRVPVLKDGDLVVWESNAIISYLADAYGTDKLIPSDPRKRAPVYQWLSWQASDLGPAIGKPFVMKLFSMFGAPLDAEAFKAGGEAAKPVISLLEKHLAGRKFVANDSFSIADIAIGESVGLMEFSAIPLAGFPNTAAWFKGMSERPSFQRTRPKQ